MENKALLIPIALIIALILVFLLAFLGNRPATSDAGEVGYYEYEGDEYLDEDYISPEEELIGEYDEELLNQDYEPLTLDYCAGQSETEMDYCYSYYAITSGDARGCEETYDSSLRDDCFAQVAYTTLEAELCEKIKVGYPECYMDVAVETNDFSLCENGNYELEKCYGAVESGKYTDCAEGYNRKICNDAVTANDASLCGQIIDLRPYCYMQIGINTSNQVLCNKAGVSKNHCFFQVALDKNNEAVCENIDEIEMRDNCVAWVAFNTGNKALCYEAGSEAQSCLEDLA